MNQATADWLIAQGWALAGWLLVVGLPPLLVYLIRAVRAKAAAATAGKHSAIYTLLAQATEMAVKAAEQTLHNNPEKKRAALDWASQVLELRGIHLPLLEIDNAVEAAVLTELDHTPHADSSSVAFSPPSAPVADPALASRLADTEKRAG